uniref:Uncharacterized protein n=1 Tax=Romanomermis culicivorax TaxID=13658 RepID=A0A915K978_ROMCU
MPNGLQPEKLVSKKHYVYYFLWSDRLVICVGYPDGYFEKRISGVKKYPDVRTYPNIFTVQKRRKDLNYDPASLQPQSHCSHQTINRRFTIAKCHVATVSLQQQPSAILRVFICHRKGMDEPAPDRFDQTSRTWHFVQPLKEVPVYFQNEAEP